MSQLGSLDPPVEERKEWEKGKEESLSWGVQAVLFFTLSTADYEATSTQSIINGSLSSVDDVSWFN